MNLDKMTVNIKPLPMYQAMDLGMAVARAWYGDLWRLWWQSTDLWWSLLVAVAVVVHYGSDINIDTVSYAWLILALWWVKPLHERRLVVFLSQKLFDENYQAFDVKQTLKNTPKVYFMLLGRLSSRRMMVMPVHILEGQKGKAAKARLRALTRRQDRHISTHSSGFFMLEMGIWLVGYMTLFELFSMGSNVGNEVAIELPKLLQVVLFVASYVVTVSILTPFFVASGFVMYLCKRSQLEGWDIELTFRKLLGRYKDSQKHHPQTHPTDKERV